jgi:hypothetical protein
MQWSAAVPAAVRDGVAVARKGRETGGRPGLTNAGLLFLFACPGS